MAKKIFPGNWVTNLSSYQGQPVVAVPGRVYYHKVGYALITSTAAKEWDVVIPSPDMRGDDKVRADIEGLTTFRAQLSQPRPAFRHPQGRRGHRHPPDRGTNETLRLASVATATPVASSAPLPQAPSQPT